MPRESQAPASPNHSKTLDIHRWSSGVRAVAPELTRPALGIRAPSSPAVGLREFHGLAVQAPRPGCGHEAPSESDAEGHTSGPHDAREVTARAAAPNPLVRMKLAYHRAMHLPPHQTLLGSLARTGIFSRHSEYLCTLGLGYLLNQPTPNDAFADYLAGLLGGEPVRALRWVTEAYQETDGGRPDLEGRRPDTTPVIKIEAKLGAALPADQLRSYATHLVTRNPTDSTVLVVLVPARRQAEAMQAVAEGLEIVLNEEGAAPRTDRTPAVVVLTWEALLDELEDVDDHYVRGDVAQLRTLYLALSGQETAPLTPADLLRWKEREWDFRRWVDEATRRFTKVAAKVLPMQVQSTAQGHDFVRRYVYVREVAGVWPEMSVGVREPFDPHTTPVWIRVARSSPLFEQMYPRLKAHYPWPKAIESEGDLWLPVDVSEEAAASMPVEHIVARTQEAFMVALTDAVPGSGA